MIFTGQMSFDTYIVQQVTQADTKISAIPRFNAQILPAVNMGN